MIPEQSGHATEKRCPDGLARYCRDCFSLRSRESYRRRHAANGRTVREPITVEDGQKYCASCKETKPLTEFPRNRSTSSGLATYCKPCHNARGAEAKKRLYGGTRHYHLKRRSGIGADEVERMVAEQGGVCAICLTAEPVHVDHCHATGKVRSILCFNCNQALGNVRDRVDVLSAAIDYLVHHQGGPVWRKSRTAPGVYQLHFSRLA